MKTSVPILWNKKVPKINMHLMKSLYFVRTITTALLWLTYQTWLLPCARERNTHGTNLLHRIYNTQMTTSVIANSEIVWKKLQFTIIIGVDHSCFQPVEFIKVLPWQEPNNKGGRRKIRRAQEPGDTRPGSRHGRISRQRMDQKRR